MKPKQQLGAEFCDHSNFPKVDRYGACIKCHIKIAPSLPLYGKPILKDKKKSKPKQQPKCKIKVPKNWTKTFIAPKQQPISGLMKKLKAIAKNIGGKDYSYTVIRFEELNKLLAKQRQDILKKLPKKKKSWNMEYNNCLKDVIKIIKNL